ncbi:MAG: type II toxin-antitoxin system RelE/ParE family toxin [Alphaproteobacteria bacterium]|nr:type II toxin-antitoxin system RelE/ParE family toxin [Alphaproteobacteria bacterium]
MTPYRIERLPQVADDLRDILRFLIRSQIRVGEPFDRAKARAAKRVRAIIESTKTLAAAPHQGTLRPDLMPGLRNVTKDRAIFYFTVDDEARVVPVLAVFFGGQDHQRAMLKRLMRNE